jgi:hypothetical protein
VFLLSAGCKDDNININNSSNNNNRSLMMKLKVVASSTSFEHNALEIVREDCL